MTVFNIFLKEVKVSSKSIIFFLLVFIVLPLVTAFLYGMGYEKILTPNKSISNIKAVYINMDKGEYSNNLKEMFSNDKIKEIVNLKEETELNKAKEELLKGNIDAAIVIPEDFSKNIKNNISGEIKVIKSPSSGVKSQIVYQIVKSYSQTFNNISAAYSVLEKSGEDIKNVKGLGNDIAAWSIGISSANYTRVTNISKDKVLSTKQFFVTSMFALVSLFICTIGALNMIKERDSKTLDRLESTSVSYKSLFYGKTLFIFITSILFSMSYILISSLLGIKWGGSPINLILIVLLHSFALTGIAAALMNILKNQKTATALLATGTGILGFIGGTFFPVEYTNVVFKKLANAAINYWIQNSYGKLMTGRGLDELAVNIIILFSIGAFGMLTGMIIARKKSRLC